MECAEGRGGCDTRQTASVFLLAGGARSAIWTQGSRRSCRFCVGVRARVTGCSLPLTTVVSSPVAHRRLARQTNLQLEFMKIYVKVRPRSLIFCSPLLRECDNWLTRDGRVLCRSDPAWQDRTFGRRFLRRVVIRDAASHAEACRSIPHLTLGLRSLSRSITAPRYVLWPSGHQPLPGKHTMRQCVLTMLKFQIEEMTMMIQDLEGVPSDQQR